ncbi:hypothetical protein TNCV_2600431 [Trichonephila clavipes]|nr:hypothetical protein TNCV_2600431 [Trichonephila clavipes]
MPRAHQAGFSRRFLAGVGFFESVRNHGPSLALLANGGVQATGKFLKSGLGSNAGEGMNVCECIMPSLHGGTLIAAPRVINPLVRLVEREERWEAPGHLQRVLPQNWSGDQS